VAQATAKVLDIGMGRALFDEASPGGKMELTNEGELLGAPDYMAPEQARNAHGADIRGDIYSMGCILYHALAGQPPFPDTSRVRQLVRHATEEPRPVRELNSAVPDGLQQILNWMLAKNPDQRYPTPQRAAQALQVFLAAGAETVPLEKDPRMRPYLQWLADKAAPTAAAPARPRTTPPPPTAGKQRPKAPVADDVTEAMKALPPLPAKAEVRRSEPTDVELVDVEPVEQEKDIVGWTRRELILLGVGVALFVVLVMGSLVVWLLLRSAS
jgi:serine/threonine protein kinase